MLLTLPVEMLQQFGQRFFARRVSRPFRNWFQLLGLDGSNHATVQTAISLRNEDLRNDLPNIDVPTGIFHGYLDQICPYDLAILMHQGIKHSRLFPFLHSGHGVFYDELPRFNRKLLQFLESSRT